MEKIFENLEKSEKSFQTASHLLYVTYSLVRDKNLLLKILTEIKIGIASCINAILQYEYLYARIRLSSNSQINFKTFIEKCYSRYNLSETDIKRIKKIFDLVEKHKKSPFEFSKQEKIVILSENMNSEIITLEIIKGFLETFKKILENAKTTILR